MAARPMLIVLPPDYDPMPLLQALRQDAQRQGFRLAGDIRPRHDVVTARRRHGRRA